MASKKSGGSPPKQKKSPPKEKKKGASEGRPTWDIDETRMTYVLSLAGDSLKTFRVRLNRWRKEKNAMHPPKEYADSISQEEWEEFLKETNSQETFLPRYKLYRAARFNKNGEIDNENAREIVRKIIQKPSRVKPDMGLSPL
ncbi:hypothetical protein RIF29_24684 [Crotalaria pallida]|uniref:Uncharacterized protein n=1 Tax=Crotalaria pallida TaxID=3830 RepID=A0AAN9HWU3_CROPI